MTTVEATSNPDRLQLEPGSSMAPDGVDYPLPTAEVLAAQMAEIKLRAGQRPVVVVQGLGFVGAAVAAAVADATGIDAQPRWFVIGVDMASAGGWWKILRINEGKAPIQAPDPEFDRLVRRGALERGNLCATASEEAYDLAEVIVVDVQLDVTDRLVQAPSAIQLDLRGFETALRTVGRRMRPDALVLVETTVPVGACEKVALPILLEERARRGIKAPVRLAHAYERVMPGPRYIDSIRHFWRSYAGIDEASAERARAFLSSFIQTDKYALWPLADTASSELGKVLENSYRAANIAFVHEWTLFAEKAGINLWAVIDSIRVRKGTHDNLRYPGFGVGGYCLTKDSLLAQWSATHLYRTDSVFEVTLAALRTNHNMPLHTLALLRELADGSLRGRRILLAGVSYFPDLADTRNSPAEVLVDAAAAEGALVSVHDPCVQRWPERPQVPLTGNWSQAVSRADAIVLALPHSAYQNLKTSDFPCPLLIVDANNVLADSVAAALHQAGCRLLGVGKGHWRSQGLQRPST
jgi:UDP-N-acetyl-D-glucosamine dehydrogenase